MEVVSKKYRDTLIATKVAGFDRYVLRAVLEPTGKRTVYLTDDPGKAQMFFSEEAVTMISKLPRDGRKYIAEPFAPAAIKNNAYAGTSH
jgi:hypothetical protein